MVNTECAEVDLIMCNLKLVNYFNAYCTILLYNVLPNSTLNLKMLTRLANMRKFSPFEILLDAFLKF